MQNWDQLNLLNNFLVSFQLPASSSYALQIFLCAPPESFARFPNIFLLGFLEPRFQLFLALQKSQGRILHPYRSLFHSLGNLFQTSDCFLQAFICKICIAGPISWSWVKRQLEGGSFQGRTSEPKLKK